MGYYSYFTITAVEPEGVNLLDNKTATKVISELKANCEDAQYAIEDDGSCSGDVKWYNFIADLCNFTKDRTNFMLEVFREGEQSEDLEKTYFFNGKYQQERAIITYHPFNPEQLQKPKE